MAIYGDANHLFNLKLYLSGSLNSLDEVVNDIARLQAKTDSEEINQQELRDDIQRIYEKELSLTSELKGILSALSKIIFIGLQEEETHQTTFGRAAIDSSFIVRRKPDGEI